MRVCVRVADLCVNVVVAIRPHVEHRHLGTESSARVSVRVRGSVWVWIDRGSVCVYACVCVCVGC